MTKRTLVVRGHDPMTKTGARMYAKLVALVRQLEQDPKADQVTLANARKAIAEYEALPQRLRDLV